MDTSSKAKRARYVLQEDEPDYFTGEDLSDTNKHPAWHWTYWTDRDDILVEDIIDPQYVRYFTYGVEIGPRSGKRHLQGMLYLRDRARRDEVVKLMELPYIHIGDKFRQHINNVKAAIAYCHKDKEVYEWGENPIKTTKISTDEKYRWCNEQAAKGNLEIITDRFPTMVLHMSKFEAHMCRNFPCPKSIDGDLHQANTWLYGAVGAGKSRPIIDGEGKKLYRVTSTTESPRFWLDSFNPHFHEAVMLEDIDDPITTKLSQWFINLLDRYPIRVEKKGIASYQIRPLRVYITSNFHPNQIFPASRYDAFARRCAIKHFNQPL